jgi:hypothetical protein
MRTAGPSPSRARLLAAAVAASLAAAGGCGDDPAPALDAGTPAPTSDAAAAAPSPPGGAADAGLRPSDAVSGMAVVKFCNDLTRGGQSITLTLELGRPVAARLMAATGECAPPVNQACAAIPAGEVPAALLDGATVLSTGTFPARAGEELLTIATISNMTGRPTVVVGTFRAESRCSSFALPRPGGDGGAADGPRPAPPDGGQGADAPRPGLGDGGAAAETPRPAAPDAAGG